MENITLMSYPEQIKSLNRLLIGLDKVSGDLEYQTQLNVERLKETIWNDPEFLVQTLIDYEDYDDFNVISERWLISSIVCEEQFLKLLAKSSLTNRITQSYVKREMSNSVKYRIRECIIACEVYNLIEKATLC